MAKEHRYEHSWSVEKPSSESHAWSYKRACDACLEEIEKRHGVDWKVTDVRFEDKGRETSTHTDWRGRRKWKCSHTVEAFYIVVRRPGEKALAQLAIIEDQVTITYRMTNIDYGLE